MQEDTTQNALVLHKETHTSLQIQKNPQVFSSCGLIILYSSSFFFCNLTILNSVQNEQPPNNVTSDSLNQQASSIPVFTSAVEQATPSTDPNSTMTTSSKEFKDVTGFRPTSETPVQLAGSSSHTHADFSKTFPIKIGINPEFTYGDHVRLLQKISMKPLSEVSRSQDVLLLRSTLENLKSCPHLNSQQTEIIQYYIEHFHTLVTCHPSWSGFLHEDFL